MRVVLFLLAAVWVAAAGEESTPRRIVSTTPSITEMLFAVGLGDRVVGVTTFCRYPEQARHITKIGTFIAPNLEVIVSLRPDLVAIEVNPIRLRARLESLGLKVLELEHGSIAGVYRSIERIGDMGGTTAKAQALNASIRNQLETIRTRTAPHGQRRMAFIVGRNPNSLEGLIAVGRASYLNELISIAGGENIFRDALTAYPKASLEEMLARDPETIVDMGEMAQTVGVTESDKQRVVALWSRFPHLAAVRRKSVFAVASDIYVVPGPRMVDAAREFARMLHPEAGE